MFRDLIIDTNKRFCAAIKDITILGATNWPESAKVEFMANLARGEILMPVFEWHKRDYSDKKSILQGIIDEVKAVGHPAADLIQRNAESYFNALVMLENLGSPVVTEISKDLYGSPYDVIPGYKYTSLQAANYFLEVCGTFKSEESEAFDDNREMDAKQLRSYLIARMKYVFGSKEIKVDLVPDLASKASVSASKVKLRESAIFREYEARQLLQHEVFTHALTSINGSLQPYMTSIQFNAPRITATQEGLAQFSELITGSIHLLRLKRIALRIIALDMAFNGADFVDLFKFFKKQGDSDEESYLSSMRIFRGGTPKGGVIFMKDGVYIKGMLEVYSFFIKSMKENNLEKMKIFFAGKMTTSDVEDMNKMEDSEIITAPKYIPIWFEQIHNLAAILAFMKFVTNLDFKKME
jgi:uncharacterized protein (TIGR02421 family)